MIKGGILIKLTNEERLYAAIHHDLVFRFLRKNRLSKDEYYDVVILAYLRAVRRYWTEEDLRKYRFSTIAWGAMRSSVGNYRKKLNRKKRQGIVVSLEQKYAGTPVIEKIVDPVDWIGRLEKRMMLMDCARKLTKEQREILFLKGKGYHLKEIAEMQKRAPSRIRKDVEQIREVLRPLRNAA